MKLEAELIQAIRNARHVYLVVDDLYHEFAKSQWVRVSKAEAKRILQMRPEMAEYPDIQIVGNDLYISPGYWDR